MQQNHTKTARQISKTDFYFVTAFYSLYDICIADGTAVRVRNFELGILNCAPKAHCELFSFELTRRCRSEKSNN